MVTRRLFASLHATVGMGAGVATGFLQLYSKEAGIPSKSEFPPVTFRLRLDS